jgi:peroxiredoxin
MIELGELEAHQEELARRNVRVVVASVDGRDEAEKTQADFPHLLVVSDPEHQLASVVDLIHPHSAPDGSDTVVPTTVLIDRQGMVRWLYRPERVINRLSTAELLAAMDKHFASGQ